MNITWFGQSFFELVLKGNEGEVKIAIDPFTEKSGLKMPKLEPHLLLFGSVLGNEVASSLKSELITIDTPGEYELKGIFIKGIAANSKKDASGDIVVLYIIEGEGMRIGHLSKINQKELTPEQIEEIGEIDVLLIPVGGEETINAKEAAEIISQIEAKIAIPMHYALPGFNQDLDGVDKFLKVMGVEGLAPQKKIKITAKDLPKEDTQIILLEP